jgi:hypothetical protein
MHLRLRAPGGFGVGPAGPLPGSVWVRLRPAPSTTTGSPVSPAPQDPTQRPSPRGAARAQRRPGGARDAVATLARHPDTTDTVGLANGWDRVACEPGLPAPPRFAASRVPGRATDAGCSECRAFSG